MILPCNDMNRHLPSLDWQILHCRGKLIDILARMNSCLQLSGRGDSAAYYLELKRAYKSEIEILQNLQAAKNRLMPDQQGKDPSEPFNLKDRKYISTQ